MEAGETLNSRPAQSKMSVQGQLLKNAMPKKNKLTNKQKTRENKQKVPTQGMKSKDVWSLLLATWSSCILISKCGSQQDGHLTIIIEKLKNKTLE